jgi:hypothetical protein
MMVIVEDYAPYLGKLSPNTINTCKFIGEMCYRLKVGTISHELIPRSAVKDWVFRAYSDIVVPLVDAKIEKKGSVTQSGAYRKASFVWVDDRMIIAAMRQEWDIKAESRANRFGITKADHGWQALAVGTCYMKRTSAKVAKF